AVAVARTGALSGAHTIEACRRHYGRVGPDRLRDPFSSRPAAIAALARASTRQDPAWTGRVRGVAAQPEQDRRGFDRPVLRAWLSRLAEAIGLALKLPQAGRLAGPLFCAGAGLRAHTSQGSVMNHTDDTAADAPYWMAAPSKPKLKLPPGACD